MMIRKQNIPSLIVEGMPSTASPSVAAICRSRLIKAVGELISESKLDEVAIHIRTENIQTVPQSTHSPKQRNNDDITLMQRAEQYVSVNPLFGFEHLVVGDTVLDEIQMAIETINLISLVFDQWGLRQIEPYPRSCLNFYGPPGTGKTLAAHAISSSLNKQILVASYAQIESKFHGDGPKNVEALFLAGQRDNAVLFIDEADSLLSKRLTSVTQGSEQAINSMRSQLLICLEKYKGVVIFATNLIENYDQAFETRVRHIYFPLPDARAREVIWRKHLPTLLPLSMDVDTNALSQIDGVCGRDIKNAVIDAAVRAAKQGREAVNHMDLVNSIERIVASRKYSPTTVMRNELEGTVKSLVKNDTAF